jgi:uncharacterized protein (DUF2336 family)
MTAIALAELTAEVDAAVRSGTPARRARMVEQFAAFFLAHAARLSSEQLNLFDNVMARLASRAEARALIELSTALAGVWPAPEQTIRSLACHDNPAVAAPALASDVLSEAELIEIARHCGQQHLLGITRRKRLTEALTDVLLNHSGKDAIRALVKNAGACFSESGFAALLAAAERDEVVAESLGLRADVPAVTLQSLMAKTTEVVRARLLKGSSPAVRERVKAAIDAMPKPVVDAASKHDDLVEARAAVIALNKCGKLNDSSVNRFAIRREYPNVIAALSLLSGASVDIIAPLMEEEAGSGLIIACRGSRLNWQTTQTVLNNRRVPPLSKEHLQQAREMFEMLYVSSAQYTIRFEMPPSPAGGAAGHDNVAMAAGGGR